MKPGKIFYIILLLAVMSGCYPKVDPSILYTEVKESVPDTLTEAGRTINEIISLRTMEQIDSSFSVYNGKSHTLNKPEYFGGFYLNSCGKLVVVVVGDTAIARENILKCCNDSSFTLQPGEFSLNELDSILKQVNEKVTDESFQIKSVGLNTRINRIIVGLKECSPKLIYRFKKNVIDSPAILFETADDVILL